MRWFTLLISQKLPVKYTSTEYLPGRRNFGPVRCVMVLKMIPLEKKNITFHSQLSFQLSWSFLHSWCCSASDKGTPSTRKIILNMVLSERFLPYSAFIAPTDFYFVPVPCGIVPLRFSTNWNGPTVPAASGLVPFVLVLCELAPVRSTIKWNSPL